MRIIKFLVKSIETASYYVGLFCGFLVIGMMLSTSREVIGRKFFNSPTLWTLELNENLMVAVAFLGGAYCALVDGHIKVDILYARLGAKAKAWIDIASSIMGLGFVTVVVWQCYIFFLKLLKTGHISEGGAGWPYWPIMLVAVIGGCLFSLQLIAKLVKAIDAAAYPNKVNIED